MSAKASSCGRDASTIEAGRGAAPLRQMPHTSCIVRKRSWPRSARRSASSRATFAWADRRAQAAMQERRTPARRAAAKLAGGRKAKSATAWHRRRSAARRVDSRHADQHRHAWHAARAPAMDVATSSNLLDMTPAAFHTASLLNCATLSSKNSTCSLVLFITESLHATKRSLSDKAVSSSMIRNLAAARSACARRGSSRPPLPAAAAAAPGACCRAAGLCACIGSAASVGGTCRHARGSGVAAAIIAN